MQPLRSPILELEENAKQAEHTEWGKRFSFNFRVRRAQLSVQREIKASDKAYNYKHIDNGNQGHGIAGTNSIWLVDTTEQGN